MEPFVVRHTLACLLARVMGRSPLEYLTARERRRQVEVTLACMEDLPDRVDTMIHQWVERL